MSQSTDARSTPGSNPLRILGSLALALVPGLLLQGCLLYTSVVNSPPQVKINPIVGAVLRGQKVTLSATATDPDGGSVSLSWSTSPGDCPAPLSPSARPPTMSASPPGTDTFDFMFASGDPATVCVWVLATDPQGATALDATAVSSQNRPPVAMITVLEPTTQTSSGRYALYSRFHLSAAASSDPDHDAITERKWTLTFPQTATPTPVLTPCSSTKPNDLIVCLDARGFAGDYVVELSVKDGLDWSKTPARIVLTVDDDHPACVKSAAPPPETSPFIVDPAVARTFAITQILDDGAPFPTPVDGSAGTPTFAWRVRRNAGAWQAIVGYDNVNALTLPGGSYATGDVVDVTVTISDGLVTHLQPACDAACPAGCPQSALWTVDYR
jgi:hypothetical protein